MIEWMSPRECLPMRIQVHLPTFCLFSYLCQQQLCLYFTPATKAGEQRQGVSINGAFQKLMLEEHPDLFQSLVLRPRSNGSRFFVSLDIDETSVFQESGILRKGIELEAGASGDSVEFGLKRQMSAEASGPVIRSVGFKYIQPICMLHSLRNTFYHRNTYGVALLITLCVHPVSNA